MTKDSIPNVGEEAQFGNWKTRSFESLQNQVLDMDPDVLKPGRGKGKLLLGISWTEAWTRGGISKRGRALWTLRLAGWCGHVRYPPDILTCKENKWNRHRLSKQQIL